MVGIFSAIIPKLILPFIANFTGGLFAGLIARKHGLIYGAIVSFLAFLFLISSLIFISYRASEGSIFLPEIETISLNLLAVILGPIGGYLGERIRK